MRAIARATEYANSKAHADSIPEPYLQALTLIEQLHRQLLEVIKDEFGRRGPIFVASSLAELDGKDATYKRAPSFCTRTQAPSLTPRQQQVLELLVEGKSNKEIARTLMLGEGTVKIHMAALFRNLGVANRAAAAVAGSQLLLDARPSAVDNRISDAGQMEPGSKSPSHT